MEVIIVTLVVSMILGVSYIVMNKEQKEEKQKTQERRVRLNNFFEQEINSIEKLELVGVGNDANSDNEFICAVKKIDLPNEIRIKIYE